ncbi:MAG TPA: hypothetical protein VFP89_02300 [Propionibacteriaceae bacterium]|nr:hypothetical protein [Propionibacteriaceae bacterium]
MTTIANIPAPSTANPCPPWCELEPGHGYHSDSRDRQHSYRCHEADLGQLTTAHGEMVYLDINAGEETAQRVPDDASEPVAVPATVDRPRIVLGAGAVELTADEALAVAEMVTQAAHWLRAIEVSADRSPAVHIEPDPDDVAALRSILDLTVNFADNDQRARYILSSNWLRDRGAAAGRHHSEGVLS